MVQTGHDEVSCLLLNIRTILTFLSNSWYRVQPELISDPETHEAVVRFVHPVGPGSTEDGWMKRNPADVQPESKGGPGSDRVLSLEEIAKHDKRVR